MRKDFPQVEQAFADGAFGSQLILSHDCAGYIGGPDPFAAYAKAVGKTPVWIFHGAQDDTIDVNESRRMAAALKAVGGTVKFAEYPEERHFIADRVFTDDEFWKWLMGQKLVQ